MELDLGVNFYTKNQLLLVNNFLLGFILIENCQNLTIFNLLGNNIRENDNFISIYQSSVNILFSQFKNISSSSSFIFWMFNSNYSLFNSIISQLIYGTYSSLNISNCHFYDSSENPGIFSISAIILEYNISFVIADCIFESLANSVAGPVYWFNMIFFIWVKTFFWRQYI